MPHVDLIVHNARELVTCASGGRPKRGVEMRDVGIVEHGAVAISEGKFVAVGASDDILSKYSADRTIDAEGKVVCPGFVDPHTHVVFAGDRLEEFELKIQGADYLSILGEGGGILSTVTKTREASVSQLVEESRRRLDKMLACGTTACEIKTGYGLNTEAELKMLAVIELLDQQHAIDVVPTLLAAHAVPREFKENPLSYVDLICGEMLPLAWMWYEQSHFGATRVPFFCDVFTERNAYDLDSSRQILDAARSVGFGIKAHVDQFTNLGGARLSIGLGAASIDHLDAISDEEVVMLADSGTIGVVIPTENFSAGKTSFANARKMIDAGCAMAVSTDYNPGSAPCPSQMMAMAIACRYQKLLPSEAFNAVTVNAAHAIGLGASHGSIEPGKRGDLCILDAEDHRMAAYEFGGNLVASVIKGGKQL